MAKKLFNGVQSGALISDSDILIRSVLVTDTSGPAHVTIKSKGVAEIVIAVGNNSSFEYGSISGGNQFSLEPLQGPVTIDCNSASAFIRVSY